VVRFDRNGVLRGLRFITDPRAAPHGAWRTCCGSRSSTATSQRMDLHGFSAAEGESRSRRLHQAALREGDAGATLMVETRFLRKPGRATSILDGETRAAPRELDAV